jgi:hypothetical protein
MSSGLERDTTDKFYTSPAVVDLCIKVFQEEVKVSPDDTLLEPSAGNGAFVDPLVQLGAKCLFYDLYPEHPSVVKQDYLLLSKPNGKTHVIGNPPFGRQSSLAVKFIRKSAEFAATISFILPKSFKKQSCRDKVPRQFHLVREVDLPDDAFLLSSKPHNVPCVFQIWERREVDREVEEKQNPVGYTFVKKGDNPHISFRRVGVYAGSISREIESKSEQSHYFLRFDDPLDIERVGVLEFATDNTVGPRSISKAELIKELNKKMKR